jgi:hypothetical protein
MDILHGIYHVYVAIYMESMDIPCISTGPIEVDTIHGISMDIMIPWIYTQYIHGISIMDIHGISFDVYTWYIRGISMDIPGYSWLSETRFRSRPVLLVSFNEHTCVGDKESCIPRTTMAIVPRERAAHKRLNPTAANLPPVSLAVAVTAAAAAVSRASFSFPSLVAGNDLHLGERWGPLSLQGR